MKFKVIKEYNYFYLGISEKGYKETFSKREYKPDEDGFIVKRPENNCFGGIATPPEKVNRKFNRGKYK